MNKLKMWIILLIANISIVNICISQNTVKIQVSGACGMCKDRIEETATKVIGVNSADYNIKKQELKVETQTFL
jgi:Fe-S cluster biogenesis protein NfuA